MKTTLRLLGLLLAFSYQVSQAQVVTWSPAFPTANEPVTITFDATKGTGGLANATPPVYAHTGVLTNLSSSDSDWRYVKAPWGTNTPSAQMESLGNNLFRITLLPRTYYNVPANEQITALMFVFRNSDGSREGKDTGGKDIKIPLYSSEGLSVTFSQPTVGLNGLFVNQNEYVQVQGNASTNANLMLYVNGQKAQEVASGTSITASVPATTPGTNKVKLVAEMGTTSVADSFTFAVRASAPVSALPANAKDGITYLSSTSVLLNLFAPGKQSAYAVGDFNNWQVGATPMNKTPDGDRFWVQIDNLTPGQEYAYQYLVDESIRIGDPYAQKILDPNEDRYISAETYPNLIPYPTGKAEGMVTVLQTNQTPYTWRVPNFDKPKKTDLVIYELLVRDFLEKHDYQTLIDTLDYLSNLGINAIELMPVQEFEGNLSWGYNSVYYSAPDKYYGPKEKLKQFIDAAHERGIAVLLDMVLNHSFGQSPMVRLYYNPATGKTTPESPWFNPDPKHDFNVGHDFNHESAATQYFVDRVNEFWLQEYNVDGYRFDLSKGFTQKQTAGSVSAWGQYDQSRIDLLKRMANHIWSIDDDAFVILEHFADNNEETVLSNHGMMLWGNLHGSYKQAILGFTANSNFNWISYKQRGWSSPNVVGYMESHDEERQMVEALLYGNSANGYNVRNLNTALDRMKLAAGFFFTVPGPKMVWQFGELGYDVSINQNGRTGNKPILWNYYQVPERKKLYDFYAALIKLRIEQPAFETTDFVLNTADALKSIHLNHSSMNVAILGNFGVVEGTMLPNFQSTGTGYDYITGGELVVSNRYDPITLKPGELRLYTSIRLNDDGILTAIKEEKESLVQGLTAFPNPTTTADLQLRYHLAATADVTIQVYDLMGRMVMSKALGRQAAGPKEVQQALVNASGSKLTPGLYLLKLVTGTTAKTVQIVVQ